MPVTALANRAKIGCACAEPLEQNDYLTSVLGATPSTIQRRLSAIFQAHQLAGHTPSPTSDWLVRTTMQGIRRTLGTAPTQKTPVVTAELRFFIHDSPTGAVCDILFGLSLVAQIIQRDSVTRPSERERRITGE